MNRGKRIAVFVCCVLVVGYLLWLVVSTWTQFKTPKSSLETTPPPYQGPEIHRAAAQGNLEKIKLKLNQNSRLISSYCGKKFM